MCLHMCGSLNLRNEVACKTRENSYSSIIMFLFGGEKTNVSVLNCSNHLMFLIFCVNIVIFFMLSCIFVREVDMLVLQANGMYYR
jgi:hypothetical protein